MPQKRNAAPGGSAADYRSTPIPSIGSGGLGSKSASFQRGERRRLIGLLVAGDLFSLVAGFWAALILNNGSSGQFHHVGLIVAICAAYFAFSARNKAFFNPIMALEDDAIYSAIRSLFQVALLVSIIAFSLKIGSSISRLFILYGFIFSGMFLSAIRASLIKIFFKADGRRWLDDLHIFDGVVASSQFDAMLDANEAGLVPSRGDAELIIRLGVLVKGRDRLIIHSCPERRLAWSNLVRALDVRSEIMMPEIQELQPVSVSRHSGHFGLVLNPGFLTFGQRLAKRLMDLTLLAVFSPFAVLAFFAIAVAIKLDSRGPIFFKQQRIGLGNRPFNIWKFRSMYHDKCDFAAASLTAHNDPRITPVGNFLRKTSLDELPQLINVLVGDMALVGPRPHAPLARAGELLYWEVDAAYWDRHVLKPGITGLAQVSGFRGNTFHEDDLKNRLERDLYYVGNWSIFLDVKILIATYTVLIHKNAF